MLHDRKLAELHRERGNNAFSVGDIYLGKVKKVMQGLNAAFVDVGHEKDAFLHYFDLGPQVRSLNKFTNLARKGKLSHSSLLYFKMEQDINKGGKISEVLQGGQEILVQVAKEPISSKGPRISSEISLAGRYFVLIPFSDRVSVSQKIRNNEEKQRLKKLIQDVKPKNFGVIVRTVAEGKTLKELEDDLKGLVAKWDELYANLKSSAPPTRVLGELSRTSAFLRDMLNNNYSSIIVDDEQIYFEVKNYLATIAPEMEKIVKLHKGNTAIFDHYGVEKQIKALFGKTVTLKSGAYLIVEKTEALHVIDVNSGNRARSENTQEANALEVNLEAAEEISRQLRLRDMGGIIVIDFIDLHSADNRKLLFKSLKEAMASDKAKHTILPPSKFGLVQITRERVRPEMEVVTTEKCPVCDGTGETEATILLTDQIENNIRYILKEQGAKTLTLQAHPFIAAYFTRGLMSQQRKWFMKYGKWVKVKPNTGYHLLEYHFLNGNNEEIKV